MTTALIKNLSSLCCTRSHSNSSLCSRLISSANSYNQSQIYAKETLSSSNNSRVRKQSLIEEKSEPNSSTLWSVIAYNLSERLRIENAQTLLQKFSEYQINDIPHDLKKEATMLSLKSDKRNDRMSTNSPSHDIFLFREGSIVFWGVPYDQQKRILYSLSPLKIEPYSNDLIQEEKEHILYSFTHTSDKSKLANDVIQLASSQDATRLHLDQFTVSHAIALSVKLGIWEAKLDQYIESVGWVTSHMQEGKSVDLTRDQVFRKTGEIYHFKHRINLSSELLDLPDVYWDRNEQEVLFLSVSSFLNIKKRTAVINEKLNNCCELMNLLSGHMNDKHHVRLEWMIISLIMVEVGFEFARLLV